MTNIRSERIDVDRACRFRKITGKGFRLACEVTRKCNLSCHHCFVPPDKHHPDFNEIRRIIQQAGKLKCRKLILTGGEPLLRKDLEEIINVALEQGMLVDLNSNLYSLNPKRAKSLHEAGLQEASVSLYGSKEIHDQITMQEGAFDKVLEGIGLLREVGVTVDVHGPIWDGMLHNIDSLVDQVKELGISSITFFSLIQSESGKYIIDDFQLSLQNVLDYVKRLRSYTNVPVRTVGLIPQQHKECVMGQGLYGLDAALRLKPCLLSCNNTEGVDLRRFSLEEAISLLTEQILRDEWKIGCSKLVGITNHV